MARKKYLSGKYLYIAFLLISLIISSLSHADDDNKSKPRVLIIGDSVSLGYTPFVIKELKDVANVEHNSNPNNAAASKGGVKNIDKWLGDTKWDIIHFNWGLWDICHRKNGKRDLSGKIAATPEQFRKNLTTIVKRLKKTNAVLIWAPITYIQGGWGRVKGDEVKYNKIAEEIMKNNGVKINDIHALTAAFTPDLWKSKGNVHFSKNGYKKIASQVSEAIKENIKK